MENPHLPTAIHPQAATPITAEQRHHMIATAAYYRAERRGFRDGDPCADWLDAEAEIDRMLNLSPSSGGQVPAPEKQAFVRGLENALRDLDEDLACLANKLRGSPRCAMDEYKTHINTYAEKRAAADQLLQVFRVRSDAAWADLKGETEILWKELQLTIDQIAAFVSLVCVNRTLGHGWIDSKDERRNLTSIAKWR